MDDGKPIPSSAKFKAAWSRLDASEHADRVAAFEGVRRLLAADGLVFADVLDAATGAAPPAAETPGTITGRVAILSIDAVQEGGRWTPRATVSVDSSDGAPRRLEAYGQTIVDMLQTVADHGARALLTLAPRGKGEMPSITRVNILP